MMHDNDAQSSARPLHGVKVLEFGHIAAGPFAALLLADLGADVVKVEGPTGDQMRDWPPIAEGAGGERFSHNFASINRNKRSIRADLKDPKQNATVRALCAEADAIVENYRPGVLGRLGLGFEELSAGHRGLVYCSVSGFGQGGPQAKLGAYDVVIQAMSGLMSVTGTPTGELVKAGVPVADFIAGLYGALSTIAWLPRAKATGKSYHLDTPMLDCLMATSALQTSEYWGTGRDPVPLGTKHPRNAPYQVFQAADGPLVLAAGNDGLWRGVCAVVKRPDLVDDPLYSTQRARVTNQDALEILLNAEFETRSAGEWIRELQSLGIPSGPVNSISEALQEPSILEGGLVQEMKIPVAGTTLTTAFPVRVAGVDRTVQLSPPRLGEHNDEVLSDWGVAPGLAR